MAWTDPETFTAGQTLSAASMNAINANITALNTYPVLLDLVRDAGFSSTATTVASASDVFATDLTWTADGTTSYLVEWFFPLVEGGNTNSGYYYTMYLVNGAGTQLGLIGRVSRATGVQVVSDTFAGRVYYTPAAGTATLNIRWTVSTGTVNGYGSTSYGAGHPDGNITLAVFGPATA